jgi:hypothetical protein
MIYVVLFLPIVENFESHNDLIIANIMCVWRGTITIVNYKIDALEYAAIVILANYQHGTHFHSIHSFMFMPCIKNSV